MYNYNIDKSIKELTKKFYKIRKIPFHKSLRKETTGIGYTFETLIGKKEDTSYQPDYKGIEIKTKYGCSKNPINLFGIVGKKDNSSNIYEYIVDNYGYFKNGPIKQKRLSIDIYVNSITRTRNGLLWKLKIDLTKNKIILLIFDCNLNIIDDKIYWNLDDVKDRLLTKLEYMALVKGYPYNRNNELYYKYTSINFYKLKGYNEFLNLLTNGDIFICMNISFNIIDNTTLLKKRNIEFRLNIDSIDKLFNKIH